MSRAKGVPNWDWKLRRAKSDYERRIINRERVNYMYDVYRREYQQQKLKTKGRMLGQMYSKEQFARIYKDVKEDLQAQTLSGDRKGIGNVYKEIVRNQAYEGKYGIAKRLLKEGAIDESRLQGMNYREKVSYVATLTKEEFRGTKDKKGFVDWGKIQEDYHSYQASGGIGEMNAKTYIAQKYFDSP